ncbi:uncharacterized [Tachysurus ichikawai]
MCPLLVNVQQRVGAQCARLCSGSQATGSIIPAVPQTFPLQQRSSVQATTTCLSAGSMPNHIQNPSHSDFHEELEKLFCFLAPLKIRPPLQ